MAKNKQYGRKPLVQRQNPVEHLQKSIDFNSVNGVGFAQSKYNPLWQEKQREKIPYAPLYVPESLPIEQEYY